MHIFGVPQTAKYSPVRAARAERGQAMLIIALAIIGLIAFIGLMVDSGILFISNGHLRRAVDAAALSAATQLREGAKREDLQLAATEFMTLNGVDAATVNVETCDYATHTPADICPEPPRKFVRVTASQTVRFAFLPIIGFGNLQISAGATSEAASVDAVIVIDTSESMCAGNPGTWPNCPGIYNPNESTGVDQDPGPGVYTGCNPTQLNFPTDGAGKCHPLWDAKFAAKAFVKKLYDGYDRIAVVHFDYRPHIDYALNVTLGVDDTAGVAVADSTGAYRAIDNIPLHDDAPSPAGLNPGQYDPLDIDCLSGDTLSCPPPTEYDASGTPKSVLSTCGGCGIRVATALLRSTGRPSALWVVIFLSDGATNLSDVPNDNYPDLPAEFRSNVPPAFPDGFCPGHTGGINDPLWGLPYCTDGGFGGNPFVSDPTTRHCGPYHPDGAATCPPGALYVGPLGYTTSVSGTVYYDVEDYARDFIDFAALTVNCKDRKPGGEQCSNRPGGNPSDKYNDQEKLVGSNMAIYSIGLGVAANPPNYAGEELLRYMAAVGDDGDRATDPCGGVAHKASCGNYYYAPSGGQLLGIFEDIAKRIFTRLTK
jgi:putative Tad-like protein involved in Flp pilus assembly